ncbi:DgyrCDS4728 [Dimorphilus gyrociliatus]|uniref:DgyrCDS4728 n=1 Tax=Dimorphilus gyrociliatus TaxID=2664684 RepID=A0A7I8VJ99_9ANNE|nr:DgyrCDS4728 [Dimorphilus gyrociliatus]
MTVCHPLDSSPSWAEKIQDFWQIIYHDENVGGIISILDINYLNLEKDTEAERNLFKKNQAIPDESILLPSSEDPLIDFDSADHDSKARQILRELLKIVFIVQNKSKSALTMCKSDLLDEVNFLPDIFDITACLATELRTIISIQDLCDISIHTNYGPSLLCNVLANQPMAFYEAVELLIKTCTYTQDETSVLARRRSQLIFELCQINTRLIPNVKALCLSLNKLPSLAVSCVIHLDSGLFPFLCSVLLSEHIQTKHLFKEFIKQGLKRRMDNERTNMTGVLSCLKSELDNILDQCTPTAIPENVAMNACNFLRVFCILRGIASLKLNDVDQQAILQLICKRQPYTFQGNRLASVGICTLMVCPTLINQKAQEKLVIDWIKWLTSHQSQFHAVGSGETSYGEILLLTAIHFHSNQMSEVAELANDIIGIKNIVKTSTLLRLRMLFTNELFPEQVVAKHAVKVKPTKNLNNNMHGYLPIHCVTQLLKSQSFAKHKIPIKDWLLSQIRQSKAPLHSELPIVITEFVNSCLNLKSKLENRNEPFAEDEIRSVFQVKIASKEKKQKVDNNQDILLEEHLYERNILFHSLDDFEKQFDDICKYENEIGDPSDSKDKTPQVLLLYYLLHYQNVFSTNLPLLNQIGNEGKRQLEYSQSFFDQLPIRALVHHAQTQQEHFSSIIPTLQRLLVQHFPHLCLVEEWLEDEVSYRTEHISKDLTEESLTKAFEKTSQSNSSLLHLRLQELLLLDENDLQKFADVFTKNLNRLLDENVPRMVINLACKVWERLHRVMPRKLRVLTVNAFMTDFGYYSSKITQEHLTIEPVLILKCDPRIYRCAPLLSILLRILESFVLASKLFFRDRSQRLGVQEKKQRPNFEILTTNEKDELSNAILMTQDAAVIQILLNICRPQAEDEEKLTWRKEMRCIVFAYIHKAFIASTALCKLVHFQGYPSSLIPLTVSGIPSMHICLDFIPELLSQPQNEKKIFAIDLLSHICLHYALPKTLALARLAINILSTMLPILNCDDRASFYSLCLRPLSRISKAFPPTRDDIISILIQLAQMALGDCAVLGLSPRAVQALDNLVKDTECKLQPRDYPKVKNGNKRIKNKHIDLCFEISDCYNCIMKQTVMISK